MFAFTNEVFEQVLKAYEMQTSPAELLEFYLLMKLEKDRGAAIVPMDLLNYIIGKSYDIDKKNLLQRWYECGLWYGKYLSIKSGDNWFQVFEKLMKKCTWCISDFSMKFEGQSASIKCVSPYFTAESTESFLKFLEGAMHSSGYKTANNECLRGMIMLEFRKTE